MTPMKRMCLAWLSGLAGLLPFPAAAKAPPETSWTVSSPDEGLVVEVETTTPGLSYKVRAGANLTIEPSPLGVMMEGETGDFTAGLAFVSKQVRRIKERYTTPAGKRRIRQVEANELVLTFANPARQRFDVIFRAANDGIAFRYRLAGKGAAAIVREASAFRLPAGSHGWLQTYDDDYEGHYPKTALGNAPGEVGFPALFAGPSTWVLLTEAAVFGDYSGGRLEKHRADPQLFAVKLTDAKVVGKLPWVTPWRVAIVGRTLDEGLKTIVESTLVEDLNPPSEIRDVSWIKPGASTFPWWSNREANTGQQHMRPFADAAAAMKWSWIEFDTGLITDPHPKDWIGNSDWMALAWPAEFVKYAKQKGLHVYGWDHWKNLETPAQRAVYFKHLKKLGIEGIKIDFMNSDTQAMFKWYDDTTRDCAKYKLMVSFHGATAPRGQQRRWPNIMSWEAVMGSEYYQPWGKIIPSAPFNTTLPFTRNVVGPMDYAGTTFSSKKKTTTAAHELALSVVFESGWQNLADKPDVYLSSVARPFLEGLPAAWDELRFLGGRPGEFVALARRRGTTWYVAGINGSTARTVSLPLGFLGQAPATVQLYGDNDSGSDLAVAATTIDPARPLAVALRASGGFAFKVETAHK